MTDLDSLTADSSNPSPEQSKGFSLLVGFMPAIIGLVGALIGGGITAYVQFHLADQQSVRAKEQRRLDRAEEIVTIIAKTPVTNVDMKTQVVLAPAHLVLPTDAERVIALVALYFPDANELARNHEAACAEDYLYFSDAAVQILKGNGPPKMNDDALYQKMLATGDLVTEKVLGDVGVSYMRRVPVRQTTVTPPR